VVDVGGIPVSTRTKSSMPCQHTDGSSVYGRSASLCQRRHFVALL